MKTLIDDLIVILIVASSAMLGVAFILATEMESADAAHYPEPLTESESYWTCSTDLSCALLALRLCEGGSEAFCTCPDLPENACSLACQSHPEARMCEVSRHLSI